VDEKEGTQRAKALEESRRAMRSWLISGGRVAMKAKKILLPDSWDDGTTSSVALGCEGEGMSTSSDTPVQHPGESGSYAERCLG
jgi:hypothetical protein